MIYRNIGISPAKILWIYADFGLNYLKNIYSIGNDISQSHITTKCLTALFNSISFKLSPLQTKPSRELATFNYLL
jgi:hypothetical protein